LLIGNLVSTGFSHIVGETTADLATPFDAPALRKKKLGDRIELQHSFPSPVSMEHLIRNLIRIKEKDLATLDKRTSERRSTLEHELATLDERAKQERRRLEQDIRVLHQAAQIEEQTLTDTKAPVKVYTKQEREELFDIRSEVMKRLLTQAHGNEIRSRELAIALDRPESTVKDYYSEQLELRPQDCFWEHGIDKAHFRWKRGAPPSKVPASVVPGASPMPDDYWLASKR
jgi:hypothetical protein